MRDFHEPMDLRRLGIYVPLAYPRPEIFAEFLRKAGGLSGLAEIGVPSRNPIYDGPVIRASHRAVLNDYGGRPPRLKDFARAFEGFEGDLVALAYYSDVRESLEGLLDEISSLGFRCLMAPDLAIEFPEELERYENASKDRGLRPCYFISPKFPYGIVERLASRGPYMIYMGLQASTGTYLPIQVLRNIAVARSLVRGRSPLAAGFGINSPEKLIAILRGGADIAVVGTELVKRLSAGLEDALKFLEILSSALKG